MKLLKWLLFLIIVLPSYSFGQITTALPFIGQKGTANPASCTTGQMLFRTDVTAGSNLYGCTSTNTWTAQGGTITGSGVAGQVTYWGSSTVLTGDPDLTFNGTTLTVTGLTVTNAPTFSALTTTRVPFAGTAGLLGDSASLTYSATGSPSGGPALTVGTGTGATAGWVLGTLTTNQSGLWPSSVTPSSTNYSMLSLNGGTFLGGAGGPIYFRVDGSATKMQLDSTAGQGPTITSGTATTDVPALSITRTNNNAAVATGVKIAYTDTSSAAGFLPFQILGTSSGTTNLMSLNKSGVIALGTSGTRGYLTVGTNGNDPQIANDSSTGLNLFINQQTTDGVLQLQTSGFAKISTGGSSFFAIDPTATTVSGATTGIADNAGTKKPGVGLIEYAQDGYLTFPGRTATDEAKKDFWITGAPAAAAAATNLTGGHIRVIPGDGASGSGGAATGGSIYLDGGKGYGTGTNGNIVIGATNAVKILLGTKAVISMVAPTLASGGCTTPGAITANGTAAFSLASVGTGCSGSQPLVFTLPAATTGWLCFARNVSNAAGSVPSQSGAVSTTSVTITNYARTTGLAAAWTDADVVVVGCHGY